MTRKIVALAIIFSTLATLGIATDKTPYKHIIGGNGYTGTNRYTFRWLVEHFDASAAGEYSFMKALVDTARALGRDFPVGPYASSQEINLYEGANSGLTYQARLADTARHWQYIYAKHYLDSIGVSVESLVVHIADNAVNITQQGDGNRSYTLTGLAQQQKRFTYQYWNNQAGDYFYPAGYVWLANGYCRYARQALAYAYRRYFMEDSAKSGRGPVKAHWRMFFMDNQYRDAGRLGSYYTINSTSGGPTSQMDWMEQKAIETDSQMYYFDHSTMRIDSAIQATLDSTCQARGLGRILGFANINKFNATHLSAVLPYVSGVSLENPIDYTKGPSNWRTWYQMADTMAAHPNKSIVWAIAGDVMCSSDPSNWRFDSTRIYMMHYAFYLTVQDTNAYVAIMRFNDTLRWRDVYEVDFGRPLGSAYEVSRTGSSDWGTTPYMYVMRRDYSGGNVVLVRTAHGTADYVRDSVPVNLHNLYYEVNAYADTSRVADSIFYMKPYMGKIFVPSSSCGAPPSVPAPSSPANGSAVSTASPTLCVTNSSPGRCPDPVTYQFEIAADQNFASIVRQSGVIPQGSSTTCFTTSAPLDLGKRYYWHCRATNGTATSQWSAAWSFTTPNTPPPAPSGSSPTNGSTLTTARPVLAVTNVADPEGIAVTYTFEVSKFGNFSSLAAQSGQVNAGAGTTSWQVTAALENGSAYFWRARAYDGIAYSAWSTALTFTISLPDTNHPPTTPVVYSPPDGATITYLPVSLTWYNATDADGDPLTYQVRLYDSAGTAILDSATGLAQGSGPTTSHSPQYQFINARWYRWQVRAYDGKALSGWMTSAAFHLDTLFGVNQPPQAPALVSPSDYDTLTSLQVTLTAGPAFDPESAPLTYDFTLYGDAAHTQVIEAVQNIPGSGAGNNIPWAVSQPLSSGKGYYWTCRASDGVGYSPWAADRRFWAFDFSVNADQQTPANLKPRSGSTVKTLRPLLEVANVVSNLTENLYYFEISEDPTFINRIYSGPVEESSSGTTSWQVSVPLSSGRTYYWRSRANNSPYSEVFGLRVQAEVFMAPNPYKSFKNSRQVKIYNMATDGVLTITTITSEVVRVLNGNASGLVVWDVTNSDGRALASDVYLCYYKDRDKAVNFKFAVIR